MISFSLYKNLFGVGLIVYLLLSSTSFADTILTALFFSSTIAFIFSRAAKPEKVEDIKVPEVHLYNSERLNMLSYYIAGSGVFSALIFYIFSSYTTIPQGFISIFLWIDMIIFTTLLKKRFEPENLGEYALVNYIYIKFDKQVDNETIKKVVRKTLLIEDDEKLIEYLNKEELIPEDKRGRFKKYLLEYLLLLQNQPNQIMSEEIEEVKET